MAIRAVEVQGVVQRAQDIGQIKQNQDQKPMTDQSNIQTNIHKEINQSTRQVVKYDNSDKKENHYDAKEKGNNSYTDSRRKGRRVVDEDADEEEGTVVVKGSRNFDVRI